MSVPAAAIWVVGAATALAVPHLWWIVLSAAIALYLLLLNRRLHDEDFLRRIFAQKDDKEQVFTDQQMEDALEGMDFETRQRIRYILQLQKEIQREARCDDAENYTGGSLDRIASQLAPLVRRAVRLASRKQQLGKYLHNVDDHALSTYCTNLEQRIAATTDPVARTQYEQALKARKAEAETYQAIAQAAGRIDSQLESVEATFASWKAKVIRIKTADVSSAAAVSEGLYQELAGLNADIDLLEGSVTEALSSDEEMALKQGSV